MLPRLTGLQIGGEKGHVEIHCILLLLIEQKEVKGLTGKLPLKFRYFIFILTFTIYELEFLFVTLKWLLFSKQSIVNLSKTGCKKGPPIGHIIIYNVGRGGRGRRNGMNEFRGTDKL